LAADLIADEAVRDKNMMNVISIKYEKEIEKKKNKKKEEPFFFKNII
jgi:hypothetical protein